MNGVWILHEIHWQDPRYKEEEIAIRDRTPDHTCLTQIMMDNDYRLLRGNGKTVREHRAVRYDSVWWSNNIINPHHFLVNQKRWLYRNKVQHYVGRAGAGAYVSDVGSLSWLGSTTRSTWISTTARFGWQWMTHHKNNQCEQQQQQQRMESRE